MKYKYLKRFRNWLATVPQRTNMSWRAGADQAWSACEKEQRAGIVALKLAISNGEHLSRPIADTIRLIDYNLG